MDESSEAGRRESKLSLVVSHAKALHVRRQELLSATCSSGQ